MLRVGRRESGIAIEEDETLEWVGLAGEDGLGEAIGVGAHHLGGPLLEAIEPGPLEASACDVIRRGHRQRLERRRLREEDSAAPVDVAHQRVQDVCGEVIEQRAGQQRTAPRPDSEL